MPSLTQLKYIISVHHHKHFGRAAKECAVSQPSLSAQIQKAEEELDLVIFDRSKKPILTTQKGYEIIQQAKIVLSEHQKIFDLSLDKELSGNFNLAVIPTLSPYLIPLFIESFSKKYPKVQLNISEYKTSDIIEALDKDEIDAALLVTPLYNDKIIERVLFYEPFYIYSSIDHPLNKRKRVKESDLDSESIWLLSEGHCLRDQVIKVCSYGLKSPVLDNIRFESGSLDTLINLIKNGRGYTLLPHLSTINLSKQECSNHLRSFQKPAPTREVSLVYSRSFLKENIIQSLEDEILDNIPNELISLKKNSVQVIDI